ncbi:hypothetical protein BRYFOR_08485 [Marvinbryantia formatexigens DSM 14469]|uniref:Uncharacterized protein n=1 Tax=Marvinbryantia formatexigens DSM 14469 TaxID=478749 RepID=C6LID0_9FIRM|nr:hypothetical protein BRYFOR_08485 [Marvinbryantia formatexigens DSM 14469]
MYLHIITIHSGKYFVFLLYCHHNCCFTRSSSAYFNICLY